MYLPCIYCQGPLTTPAIIHDTQSAARLRKCGVARGYAADQGVLSADRAGEKWRWRTDHFDINQLLYCHHSAIFLTKYCDLWWCHCSVRCGHMSASILTLKQYLAKVPTFHVQCSDCVEVPFYNSVSTSVKQRQCIPFDHPGFSFCCQGFPLVTKIFPLVTKDFPFVNASTQPTEPFHIHSLLHSYVGMILKIKVWH